MNLSKMAAIVMIALATTRQAHAQIIGSLVKEEKDAKNYVPVFEIEGKTQPTPSILSMYDKYKYKIVFSGQLLNLNHTSEALSRSSFNLGVPVMRKHLRPIW